jgi:uncharacterized membrane protein YebE (DUF533 family)
MFDAKSLLEMLVKGAAAPSRPAAGGAGGPGGLGDLLGQVLGGAGRQGGQAAPQGGGAGGMGGLEDLLRNMLPGGQGGAGQAPAPQAAPQGGGAGGMGGLEDLLRNMLPGGQGGAGQAPAPQAAPQGGGAGGMGGLEDILRRMGGATGGAPSSPQMAPGGGGAPAGGGGLMDILGQILGQAQQGVREGAGRIEDATGAGSAARDALGRATGRAPEDILAQVKEWVQNNQMAAGAAAGGLGGLVLGTRTGRSAATTAAKLGALVMIGGLAYKAYQNYAQGRAVLGGAGAEAGVPAIGFSAAPSGSGFEPDAITNDDAVLYIRAMIGAAAADGRIDPKEHQSILGGLEQAGFGGEARAFIEQEIQSPATAADLASAVTSAGQAVQVFTAARLAVDVDTEEEHAYLVELAERLQLDPQLVAHIDAEANNAAIAA